MAAAGEARLGDETIAVLAGRIDAADPDQKDLAEELECSIGGHPAFECSVETAPCSHIFHRDCLGRWLEGKVGGAHCCPVCREVLPPGRLGGTAPSPAAPASPSAGRCGSSDADSFYTAAAASAGGCTALPGGGSPPLAPPPPLSPEPGGGGAEAEAAAAAGEQFDGTGLWPPALTAGHGRPPKIVPGLPRRATPTPLQQFLHRRLQKEYASNNSLAVACPDCGWAGELARSADRHSVQCGRRTCLKKFCGLCGEAPHLPLSCEQSRARADGGGLSVEQLKALKIARCPTCGMGVQRSSSCKYMECRKDLGGCGQSFCILCGRATTRGPYDDGHECVTQGYAFVF